MKLCFGKGDLVVKGFSNVNFVGNQDDHKSTSSHVFLFGGTAVSSSSKKQTCVARYKIEAELGMAMLSTNPQTYLNPLVASSFVGCGRVWYYKLN